MIQCVNCKKPYPIEGLPYLCPNCRGIYDFDELPKFERNLVKYDQPGIWKYKDMFGLAENLSEIYLGEGNTPLVWSEVREHDVAFKIEYQNPTGSFKDRGTATIVSFLKSRNIDKAVEDSSGNAGASFAAYTAQAGIEAHIFVPDGISAQKLKQMEVYCAKVTRILGPRSNTSEAVKRHIESGIAYGSHVYLPHNIAGYATISFELVEQLGEPPGSVLMPVGHGGLLLGVGRGFEILKQAGEINCLPRLIGIQARACAPLWAVYEYGPTGLMLVDEGQTIAEGIRIKNPIRGDAVLEMIQRSNGMIVAVDEKEIESGYYSLARKGFYVEYTSAVVWEPLLNMVDELTEPVVVILTGSGLKT